MNMLIARKIHYCWFGNKPKPEAVLKYIEGWRSVLPDYEIIEWNESNFDINICNYVTQAYKAKKYAFVSDYARLFALYNYGGIYLDTDVEVCKDLDPLIESGLLTFGFEEFNYIATSTIIAPKSSFFIKAFMQSYHNRSFLNDDYSYDQTTNVQVLTEKLVELGLQRDGSKQELNFNGETIKILNQILLSPFDYSNYIDKSDYSTYTIHHYGQSWANSKGIRNRKIKNIVVSIIGGRGLRLIRSVFYKQS